MLIAASTAKATAPTSSATRATEATTTSTKAPSAHSSSLLEFFNTPPQVFVFRKFYCCSCSVKVQATSVGLYRLVSGPKSLEHQESNVRVFRVNNIRFLYFSKLGKHGF